MLLFGTRLIGTPIMGLQTGQELARTSAPVINPHSLSIIAYVLEGPQLDTHPSILRIADIREYSDLGMIVDSSDEFIAPEDVIKVNEIYELGFQLIDIQVQDEKKRKLGKVIDYSVEIDSFVIQQLLVKRPLIQSFGDSELTIHRSQIIEVTDTHIVVHSSETRAPEPITEAVRHYANPFRQHAPQPESNSSTPAQS